MPVSRAFVIAGLSPFVCLAMGLPATCEAAEAEKRAAGGQEPKTVSLDLGGKVKLDFVLILPGAFTLGDDTGGSLEKPAQKVTIPKPFYLGKYEITQEQWQALMNSNPSYFRGATNPVEHVSWEDCQAFLKRLTEKFPGKTFRLPTEAEWEFACRAGTKTSFSSGDDEATLGQYAWFSVNTREGPHPVGTKKPNSWGLYDMHGNVFEWCQSLLKAYPYRADDGREDLKPTGIRVLRGGSLLSDAHQCGCAHRFGDFPDCRIGTVGFRVAWPLP